MIAFGHSFMDWGMNRVDARTFRENAQLLGIDLDTPEGQTRAEGICQQSLARVIAWREKRTGGGKE